MNLTKDAHAESPRWLLKAGHREEALAVLTRIRTEKGQVNEDVITEFNEIDESIKIDGEQDPGYLAMAFSSRGKLHLSRRVSY